MVPYSHLGIPPFSWCGVTHVFFFGQKNKKPFNTSLRVTGLEPVLPYYNSGVLPIKLNPHLKRRGVGYTPLPPQGQNEHSIVRRRSPPRRVASGNPLVPTKRLELLRLTALDPKSSVATNYTTSAYNGGT